MSGSSKDEQEPQVGSSTATVSTNAKEGVGLADFLAPMRPRSSVIPPSNAVVEAARTATISEKPSEDARTPSSPPVESAAGSLIPVARTADELEDLDDQAFDELPENPPITSVRLRRVTVTALLAAAAAVPMWLMMRTPKIDVQTGQQPVAIQQAPAARPPAPTGIQPASLPEDDGIDLDEDPPPPAAPIDPAKALEIRMEARRLLESGQIEKGVAAARRAIEANPSEPECYVLLAAGLQDMGRWAESREVFSKCVNKSNKTINAECAYFATSNAVTNR